MQSGEHFISTGWEFPSPHQHIISLTSTKHIWLVLFPQIFLQRFQQLKKHPSKVISARHKVRVLEAKLEALPQGAKIHQHSKFTLVPLVSWTERSMPSLPHPTPTGTTRLPHPKAEQDAIFYYLPKSLCYRSFDNFSSTLHF